MSRYNVMFKLLAKKREGAFIPFVMLGDPSYEACLVLIRALIRGGADALELGIPFSDPVADGPTIEAAGVRALRAGVTPVTCWKLLARIREEHPTLPLGLLVYANLVVGGGMERFYASAAHAGVDSVLIADVPTLEVRPFYACALRNGVDPVLIVPPNVDEDRLLQISEMGRGYTYVVTRSGVTGADEQLRIKGTAVIYQLHAMNAPPPVFGFGISEPDHVRTALDTGAAGAISGSAVVRQIEPLAAGDQTLEETAKNLEIFTFRMKGATRPS